MRLFLCSKHMYDQYYPLFIAYTKKYKINYA